MTTTDDHDQSGTVVEREVTTDLEAVRQDAAIAVSINPMTAEVIDAGVTDTGELRLDVRGEQL